MSVRNITPRTERNTSRYAAGPRADSLADVLERVLDRGVVIAGDVVVHLLDIELLTLKLRLVVASVDTATKMGMDWWTRDPFLNSRAQDRELQAENQQLRARLEALEGRLQAMEEPVDRPRTSPARRPPGGGVE
jgi:uncharacterized protein YlxW (UPF0749 family)